MSKISLGDWIGDFAMDEHEKSRLKGTTNELASLISSLNLQNEDSKMKLKLLWMKK